MRFLKKLINFYFREYKINLSGFHDILTNIAFFFISIFIFIFSIGQEKEMLSLIGIGILWTLLLLSSTLSLRKFYQDDFENGNIAIMHLNGFSLELIVILKTLSHFIFVQIPFLISIPIACILINVSMDKMYINIHKYGNTTAGTIPIAMCEALAEGKFKKGDNIILTAFGGGYTWASAAIRW